ncbi:MAG: Ca2+:H+ antiporter, partial [Solirubrobacteraceae bacterium]|nr:Ca2+:H+ antiporter [Solirubrobacteraceae bacterium]
MAVLDRLAVAGDLVLFVLAAAALVPLGWLIGEATDQAAHHTGPGIGGLLNASFGNAPELIIALVALSDGLTGVVRASLAGSIIGNLLLVLGFALLVAPSGTLDRASGFVSLGTVAVAVLLLLIPSVAGSAGNPDRHSLAVLSVPFAVALLAVRVLLNTWSLRRHRRLRAAADPVQTTGWSLRLAVAVLAVATLITAFVSETLVGSIDVFAAKAHLSQFFVAAVIVAIVGNATEHGSAILLAARGQLRLAAEIALASSAQVAGLLIPAVAILSWAIEPLALSFRAVELVGIGAATLAAAAVIAPRQASRAAGAVLVGAYVLAAVSFYLVGDG